MKKTLSVVLALLMLLSFIPVSSFAVNAVTANGIVEISKYGNVKINLSHDVISENFELGDIVTVSFGEVSIDVPLCIAFSDVDSGKAGMFCQISGGVEETELAINMGNFAETYGIANKTVFPDKTYTWEYQNGFSDSTLFTVTLKQAAGYLDEFTVRNLIYTDAREDYPNLSDEEFANFRAVTVGNIANGILYRSASPVDPTRNRNKYADKASEKNGITHFINLGDSDDALVEYEGYSESYYKTVTHIAVEASINPAEKENKEKYAECFRYIINNPAGKFDVHCREGKDRTGMFIAITECLMGASYDEISSDYMITYMNYYGLTTKDEAYKIIENGVFKKSLSDVFGVGPENADLKKEAKEYLKDIGLSNKEIFKLKFILSGHGWVLSLLNVIVNIISLLINLI